MVLNPCKSHGICTQNNSMFHPKQLDNSFSSVSSVKQKNKKNVGCKKNTSEDQPTPPSPTKKHLPKKFANSLKHSQDDFKYKQSMEEMPRVFSYFSRVCVPLEYHKNSWIIMNLKPVEVIYVNPLQKGTFIANHLKHQKTPSAKYSPVPLFVDGRLGRFKKSRVSIHEKLNGTLPTDP